MILLLHGDWRVLLELDFNSGDLLVLLAMFGFATYGINIRRIPAEFHVPESLFAIILLGMVPLLRSEYWLVTRPHDSELLLKAMADWLDLLAIRERADAAAAHKAPQKP